MNNYIKIIVFKQFVKAIIRGFQLLQTKLNQSPLDSFQLVGIMKQLVPEFVSNNSEFEQLEATKVMELKKG